MNSRESLPFSALNKRKNILFYIKKAFKFIHIVRALCQFFFRNFIIKMKLKCENFLYFLLFFSPINSISTENEETSDKNETQNPIAMRGWLHYFVYDPKSNLTKKPNSFFVNKQYSHQFDNKHHLNALATNIRDEYGFVHIPSPLHFFFVLSTDTLYVISARKVFL